MLKNELLQGLNDAQREAVLHGEGPALVAAGPGSGKTRCITHRLLYLILECEVPPQEILVITFTKEAAKTMQERFVQELQQWKTSHKYLSGFVSFGTFHSFFYQIIKSIPKYSEYQLITHQEKLKIAKEILKKESSEEVTETDIQQFLTGVSYFKNTGELSEAYTKKVQVNAEEQSNLFERQFKKYESEKKKYKRLDFDDMLYLCKKELEKSAELLTYWQKQFSYILVDEAQDINPIQYELLRQLSVPPYNLFLVGDDDQAIYGFRGSKAGIFQEFMADYPMSKQICLAQNYRCAEDIVNASKRLIEGNKCRVTKQLISAGNGVLKGEIQAYGAISNKESYDKVMEGLKKLRKEELNKQAVLFRTNFAMQTFATRLSVHNIPFVMREKISSIYEHFLVRDILDYFYAASGRRDRSLFLRIFLKLRIPLGREALRSEQVDLHQVKEVYASGFYENRQAYEEVEALERNLARLSRMRPSLGIKYILHAMEYQKYLLRRCGNTKELLEEWQQLIDWLMEDAEEYIDYKSWEIHIQDYKNELEKNVENKLPTMNVQRQEGIHLLTLHASKGLEFQKVYIMNVNEGTIPQLRRGEPVTEERLEEERRLFYVGMTRAKEALELHYITGTTENPRFRSRFLKELELPKKDIHEEDEK